MTKIDSADLNDEEAEGYRPPKRPRAAFLKRHILSSDSHGFVGRIFGLSIVGMRFSSWNEVEQYPDCRYALETNEVLTGLTTRVESLNLVGSLLWPEPFPTNFKDHPVSRYEWLSVAADVFLMRYISVADCALLLVNTVCQLGLSPRQCTPDKVTRGCPAKLAKALSEIIESQGNLRAERNARIHHGLERHFTDDDQTLKTVSFFENRGGGMTGTDRFGRRIIIERAFREGLVSLQRDFNQATRKLVRQLDRLYDELAFEFEGRFGPLIAAATHGWNANAGLSCTVRPS